MTSLRTLSTRLASWSDCVVLPQGADPSPLPLRVAKAGRNHLNEEISTFLLPTEIDEQCSQTISNLGHAALCADVNSPYKGKC
jgi:hypothetical protein